MQYELFLIGTNHLDTKGPKRLKKIIKFLNPDLICLEQPEEKIEIKRNHKKFQQSFNELPKPMIKLLNQPLRGATKSYGYEVQIKKYSKVPILKIDKINFHKIMQLQMIEGLKQIKSNPEILKETLNNLKTIKELSKKPYKELANNELSDAFPDLALLKKREESTANKLFNNLKKLIKKTEKSLIIPRLVYIGGLAHVTSKKYPALHLILKKKYNLDFKVILLDEIKDFIGHHDKRKKRNDINI